MRWGHHHAPSPIGRTPATPVVNRRSTRRRYAPSGKKLILTNPRQRDGRHSLPRTRACPRDLFGKPSTTARTRRSRGVPVGAALRVPESPERPAGWSGESAGHPPASLHHPSRHVFAGPPPLPRFPGANRPAARGLGLVRAVGCILRPNPATGDLLQHIDLKHFVPTGRLLCLHLSGAQLRREGPTYVNRPRGTRRCAAATATKPRAVPANDSYRSPHGPRDVAYRTCRHPYRTRRHP